VSKKLLWGGSSSATAPFFSARRETEILEQPQTAAHEHVHDHVNIDVRVIVDVFGFFFVSRNSQTPFFSYG
jgi:hypothetical protein